MDLRKLKKLIDLVQESGISELEVTEGEEKVRIAKHLAAAPQVAYMQAPTQAADDSDCPVRKIRVLAERFASVDVG